MSRAKFLEHFATVPQVLRRIDEVRFDGECWLFPVNAGTNYARIKPHRNQPYLYVHRVSLRLKTEVDLTGLEAAHICDRPPCVNPEHLFVATHRQNMADMMRKGRGEYRTFRGDDSTTSKLTKDEVVEVLRAHAAGESMRSLERRLPVSRRAIHFWVHGKTRLDAYREFHATTKREVAA